MRVSAVEPFYEGWRLTNEGLIAALAPLSTEQLALPVGSPTWPVWASVAHLAGARVFWLCHVFGEPGAETTPFTDPTGFGWDDDLAHPRSADELVGALKSSWRIVERCLTAWTPEPGRPRPLVRRHDGRGGPRSGSTPGSPSSCGSSRTTPITAVRSR